MSDILRHDFRGDLEIRSDGRTVYGLAVPFDTPQRVSDLMDGGVVTYDEVFRNGAFTDTIRERGSRVKFLLNHDKRSLPLGPALSLREDAAGLVGEFRVSNTRAGDEALELIRDGALDGLSVGFKPLTQRGDERAGKLVERLSVKLIEVSAVAFPAYDGALIAGVRSEILAPDQGTDTPDQGGTPDQGAGQPDQQADPTFAARRRLRLYLGANK